MKIPLICSWMRQHGRRQEPLGNETLSEEGKAVGHLSGWDKGFRRQTPWQLLGLVGQTLEELEIWLLSFCFLPVGYMEVSMDILPHFIMQNLPVLLLKQSRSREHKDLPSVSKMMAEPGLESDSWATLLVPPLFPPRCYLKTLSSDLLTQSYACNASSTVLTAPDLWCCEGKGQNPGVSSWAAFPTELSCSSVCAGGEECERGREV